MLHSRQGRSLRSIQRQALGNVADGICPSDVVGLASLGSLGRHPANIERDLFRKLRRQMGDLLGTYTVKIPSAHASGTTTVDLLLPHELWAWMWRAYPAHAKTTFVGQDSDLVKLWEMTLEHNPDKLADHPALDLIRSRPQRCVPIRLWGDDAPLGKKGRGLRALSWSSATVVGESMRCKMPIFAIDNRNKTAATDDALMDIAAWSFNTLLTGRHPATDHEGKPWTGNRAKIAGRPLIEGEEVYTAVWYELGGDWDYLSEEMRLEQDMHHNDVCMWCQASKLAGPLNYCNAAVDAECFQPHRRRTYEQYIDGQLRLAHGRSPLPPLCNIMGFTIFVSGQ